MVTYVKPYISVYPTYENHILLFSLSDAQQSSDTVPPHAPDSKVLM